MSLLWICFFFHVASAANSGVLELKAISEVQVEGRIATFECRHHGGRAGATLSWYLLNSRFRNPNTHHSVPLFEVPSGGPHSVSTGPFRFNLTLRRDFEGNWLVCNSTDGGEAKFTFGRIEKTIGIHVILPSHTYLVMEKRTRFPHTQFCCNVTAPFEGTMQMLVYYEKPFNLNKMDKDGTYFCHNMDGSPQAEFWVFMSCVARSKIGTVYSQIEKAFFFNPTFHNTLDPGITVFFDEKVTITVSYTDTERPISTDVFKIFKIDNTRKQIKSVTVSNVSLADVGNFEDMGVQYNRFTANITFVPESTGTFQLFFVIRELGRIQSRDGPTFNVLEQYAKISAEKLQDSLVTLGAFARLSFRLSTSTEPLEGQISVKRLSGSPQDVYSTFERNPPATILKFVFTEAGRYRVEVRLPRVVAKGSWHQIKAERPSLRTPPYPKEVLWENKAITAPVTYIGRQPPAFPTRAFRAARVDDQGTALLQRVPVTNVTMGRLDNGKRVMNVSFLPGRPGYYQISIIYGFGSLGVRVKEEPMSRTHVVLRTFAFIAVLLLLFIAVGFLIYRRRTKQRTIVSKQRMQRTTDSSQRLHPGDSQAKLKNSV